MKTIRVSMRMFVRHESLRVAALMEPTDSFLLFLKTPARRRVWKRYRPQLSPRKSPGGQRETTCRERRLGTWRRQPELVLRSIRQTYAWMQSALSRLTAITPPALDSLLKTKGAGWIDHQPPPTRVETRPAQVIPHKSGSIIITIQFYIQISVSNKIPTRIQRLIMRPFSAGGIFFFVGPAAAVEVLHNFLMAFGWAYYLYARTLSPTVNNDP